MITVLVIDADPVVRLVARRVLEPAGFTPIAVADASAALARLAVVRTDLFLVQGIPPCMAQNGTVSSAAGETPVPGINFELDLSEV